MKTGEENKMLKIISGEKPNKKIKTEEETNKTEVNRKNKRKTKT